MISSHVTFCIFILLDGVCVISSYSERPLISLLHGLALYFLYSFSLEILSAHLLSVEDACLFFLLSTVLSCTRIRLFIYVLSVRNVLFHVIFYKIYFSLLQLLSSSPYFLFKSFVVSRRLHVSNLRFSGSSKVNVVLQH